MILQENTKEKVASSTDVFELMKAIQNTQSEIDRDKEHFWALGLDAKNKIKYIDLVFVGSLNQCSAEPRELFRLAVIKACSSLLCCHNHPSGDPKPSPEDKQTTQRLQKAGEILGIKLLDHVIIGKDSHYSFVDEGLLSSNSLFYKK